MKLNTLFTTSKPIIGVVHLLALPGTPKFAGDLDAIIERALKEVNILKEGRVDGIIIENFNDVPFLKDKITKEQFGLMASIITLARKETDLPLGINVHFNDWEAEIALAYSCRAQFTRIEAYIDTVVTASGIVEPCCAEVTRYRELLGSNQPIEIWADIHPKYSKNLIPSSLQESAKLAQYALADAIIVTGETTGVETPLTDLENVKKVVDVPVLAGSGTNLQNVRETLATADGVIVGSAFKEGGKIQNMVSLEKVAEFTAKAHAGQG